MSFTRALEVSEALQQQPQTSGPVPGVGPNPNHHMAQFSGPGLVEQGQGQVAEGDKRESVYDYHEISVWQSAKSSKQKSKRPQQCEKKNWTNYLLLFEEQ